VERDSIFRIPPQVLAALEAEHDDVVEADGLVHWLVPEPTPETSVSVEPLLDLLEPWEIEPNTRLVLERVFSQLPPHLVEVAASELRVARDVRRRAAYLVAIGNRMLRDRERRRAA
jgi:hypothetical protein